MQNQKKKRRSQQTRTAFRHIGIVNMCWTQAYELQQLAVLSPSHVQAGSESHPQPCSSLEQLSLARNPFRCNCRLLQTHCNMAWHSLQNRNKRHPNRRRSPFRRKRNPYTYNQHHSMRMVRLGCLIRRCSWRRDHKPCRGKEPQHLKKSLSTSTLKFSN